MTKLRVHAQAEPDGKSDYKRQLQEACSDILNVPPEDREIHNG